MLNLQTIDMPVAKTYAQRKNAKYSVSTSHVITVMQRWKETYNALPAHFQLLVDDQLESAKQEFKRRNPTLKKFTDIALAEAKIASLMTVKIDATMQRQLNIMWVLKIINQFLATLVVPIQVYRPDPNKDEFVAWDGQHTLVALWLISTYILEENPMEVNIPVNIYQSFLKAEMRANFIIINGVEGKKPLELIDIWEQMIYGVRIDNSKNPLWLEAERKQRSIEKWGLFVTSKKFGDDQEPGAISRLQEINKSQSIEALCQYLATVTQLQRAVSEKEMVMMSHYFDRCRIDGIEVTTKYVTELANTMLSLFDADFTPHGKFWSRASNAYDNWYQVYNSGQGSGRFAKEPVHGFPFLLAQLKKSFKGSIPRNTSRSSFYPSSSDLF